MYEWLLRETLDFRFILLVLFGFGLLCILVGAVAGGRAPQDFGPDPEPTPIKDGQGRHRDDTRKPDDKPRKYTPRKEGTRPRVRFVDEDILVDEKTGEVLN